MIDPSQQPGPAAPSPDGGAPPPGDDVADEQELVQFLPLAYEELRSLAANLLRGRRRVDVMRATSLVHEAWLRLAPHGGMSVRGRGHFLAIAARAMRHVLVDNARREHALKRGGDRERVALLDEAARAREPDPDVLAVDEALTRLSRLDPRKGRVVELRFFGGLDLEETAEVLGVSVATVKRDWVLAKAWLHRDIHEGGAGVA
ncbi:MAG TPA: ECF-type sigma factor [Planctomycetota bacterium]|nr:ECF-type sigma factor [Planctomycetota bacterium]